MCDGLECYSAGLQCHLRSYLSNRSDVRISGIAAKFVSEDETGVTILTALWSPWVVPSEYLRRGARTWGHLLWFSCILTRRAWSAEQDAIQLHSRVRKLQMTTICCPNDREGKAQTNAVSATSSTHLTMRRPCFISNRKVHSKSWLIPYQSMISMKWVKISNLQTAVPYYLK